MILLFTSILLVVLPFIAIQLERGERNDILACAIANISAWMKYLDESESEKDQPYPKTPLKNTTTDPNQSLRKPWNPPFPVEPRKPEAKRAQYLTLPKLHLPHKNPTQTENDSDGGTSEPNESESRQKEAPMTPGTATMLQTYRRLPPPPPTPHPTPSLLSTPTGDTITETDSASDIPTSRREYFDDEKTAHASRTPKTPVSEAKPPRNPSSAKSALWVTLQLILLVLVIFAFVVLIAHCMAWFVVYKTESRLRDMRKGLLRGGEMRMCLCA